MGELFGKENVRRLGDGLVNIGKAWWSQHGDAFADLSKDEAEAVLSSLKRGDTVEAKFQLALRMNPDEWKAYRDGTVDQLRGIAIQRAKILEALDDLGRRSAQFIGRVAEQLIAG